MADNVLGSGLTSTDHEVSVASWSPFSRVPNLLHEFRYVFMHPTFTNWPSGHVCLIRQMMSFLQYSLEEIVASALSVADFVDGSQPILAFGHDIPTSTFSDLVLGVLHHSSSPYWTTRQIRLMEEGARTLLMLIEIAVEEAGEDLLLAACNTLRPPHSPHKRFRDK